MGESNNKRIVKNSVLLALRMVIITFISIFTTRFLLRNLGVEDFGVYNVTLGIVSMCSFLGPALSNAIQRYYNFELGKNGDAGATRVLNTGIIIQFGIVVILVLICETIGLWYVNNKLVVPEGREMAALWVYQLSVLAFSISLLQIPFVAAILAHERMNFYAIVNILDAVLKLGIAIAISYASFDRLIFYGVLLILVNIMSAILYIGFASRHFDEVKISMRLDKALLRGMTSFTGWNLFETIARIFKDQGCNLLLNFYYGPVLNAARGVANQVSYGVSSIVESTIMASRPQMVKSYAQGNDKRALEMFYTLSKCTVFLIFIVSLPIFLEIDYILKIWLGGEVPQYANLFIRLSILIALVDKLASPVTAIIHATGKVKRYHINSGVINLLVLPLAWAMLSFGCGASSVYWATLIFAVVAQIVFLFIVRRLLPFSIRRYLNEVGARFLIVLLISVVAPYFIMTTMEEGLLRLLLVLAVAVLVSLISIIILGLNKSERDLMISLIRRK